ncbi:MAG: ABC transporter permease [Acidobacteriota bacterium]|nr:ABC transporter permease [Acidobacteriota bacterium]
MRWIMQDFRYGVRGLFKQPGFALVAVLALALGIGAATTIFSVIENVLLDPFPYTDAQRVVSFYIHDVKDRRPDSGRSTFRPPEFMDYQDQNHVFEEVIGGGNEDVLYTTAEGTEQFDGAYVTPNTFRFLGVPALLGRGIAPDDAKPGAPPVFVMSYKMWGKRFSQDRSVIGRVFVLNGVPTTLVGIMPRRFTKMGVDLWRPIALDRADPENYRRYFLMQGRMKPGIGLREVESDITVIAQRLAKVYPKDYPETFTIRAASWIDILVGHFRKTLYTLCAAVGLLLLIACTNVANMLLARATAREKEMAIRSSLGASRGRLIRQLLMESFLLAVGGAAVGCLFAYGGIKALVMVLPDNVIPQEAVIQLNVPVLLFSLGIAGVTAILFGLAPALQTARRDLVEPLKDSGKGVSGGFRRGKLRNTLVVVEVALSLVLLSGAGLLMRTFVALQEVDLGLNPDSILVARLPLPRGQYKTAADKQRFFRQLLPRLYALPGIVAATETSTLPPYGGIPSEIEISGKTHAEKWEAIYQLCSEGYFPTLGLRLLRGRVLSEAEVNDARKVAVVNQTLVTKYFGKEDPIGKQIKINMLETVPNPPVKEPVFEVVGVIADAKNSGIQEPVRPEMFIPYTVTGAFERGILVRTSKDPMSMLNAVRREIWAVDRNVALTLTGSLKDYLKLLSYAEPRFTLILLGVFAGVGLVLVAIGVYSVIAYTVSRQTHEIGIRMALGAGRGDVLGMVLRMGVKLIGLGVAAGLLASFGLTRLIASQLWGVSAHDAVTFVGVVVVVALAGLAACYLPARRATLVDPMVALRYE